VFDKQDLVTLTTMTMPFGKYQGRPLIDLPEEYLLWFAHKGFPAGKLGMLLGLTLEIKINGLESIIKPLKDPQIRHQSPEQPGKRVNRP
jgi:hypothetical protein